MRVSGLTVAFVWYLTFKFFFVQYHFIYLWMGEKPEVEYTHYAFRLILPSFRMPLYKEKILQEDTS